jgi:hypothetical protein
MPERANANPRHVPRAPLHDIAALGFRLRVTCTACLRWVLVDPRPLLPRHGATPINMLRFRSRCCRARGVPTVSGM